MKRTTNLIDFKNILPYASEIFGVYQPMLGWKSKRTKERIEKGFANDLSSAYNLVYKQMKRRFGPNPDDGLLEKIHLFGPAILNTSQDLATGSFVIDSIASKLPPLEEYDNKVWNKVIRADRLNKILTNEVAPRVSDWYQNISAQTSPNGNVSNLVADQLNRESAIAGYVLFLREQKHFDKLKQLFYQPDDKLNRFLGLLNYQDPFEVFDPLKEIDRVCLSPVGIVHLFRQYFFEFDTFLGPPVNHVWLSPGAIVELVEISTRKTITERTFESIFETIVKTEKSTTEEDEISDAVKNENRSDTKFGLNGSINQGWVGGSANASSTIDIGTTQSKAREEAHRHMRQQTEKLSTEIRKNYKSTFKTVTEVTDISSKRYYLENKTKNLINYELRRKMRQVGVQVQDIGTYLCWQTYVDDPGRQLGIA
jgi:hypothetical protein